MCVLRLGHATCVDCYLYSRFTDLKILRTLEGHDNIYLSQSGPHFGTRESMRAVCQYELKTEDVKGGRSFDDSVALGGW